MLRPLSALLLVLLLGAQLSSSACPMTGAAGRDAPERGPHATADGHHAHHAADAPAGGAHDHDEERDCPLLMACGTWAPPRVPRPASVQVDERLVEHRTVAASHSSNAPDLELPPPRAA